MAPVWVICPKAVPNMDRHLSVFGRGARAGGSQFCFACICMQYKRVGWPQLLHCLSDGGQLRFGWVSSATTGRQLTTPWKSEIARAEVTSTGFHHRLPENAIINHPKVTPTEEWAELFFATGGGDDAALDSLTSALKLNARTTNSNLLKRISKSKYSDSSCYLPSPPLPRQQEALLLCL